MGSYNTYLFAMSVSFGLIWWDNNVVLHFYCHMLFHFHEYTKISLHILMLIENLSGSKFGDIIKNVDINVIVHVFGTQKHSLKVCMYVYIYVYIYIYIYTYIHTHTHK